MAESAVSLVIDKLAPLLAQGVQLLKGVYKEVVDIKDDLEAIRAFLKDADSKAEKEGASESVKVWVKQAREVAYQIEDVIDEYNTLHVAQHRDRRVLAVFLTKVSSLVRKLPLRHKIASEIHGVRKTLQRIKDRSEGFRFASSEQGGSSNIVLHDPRLGSHFIEDSELVGIESTKDELISLLVSGECQRTAIAVVGMGGVGKTTLAKKVYDSYVVKQHSQCRAWITVSQSYDRVELLRSTLKKLYEAKKEPFPEAFVTMDALSLIDELRKYLQQERYLVVFDDVWEIRFWGDVEHALVDNNKGSKILVTTRNEDVANFCRRSSLVHVYQMKSLPQREAWELFCKKAFKFDFEGNCPKDLEEFSQDIVRRCGGLPLAIVAVGGLLATKERVIPEWQKVVNSLDSTMASDPHVENVTKILSLSFHDLPYDLKACFLYFGMLPEDFSIKRTRIIRLWVAQGFVQEKRGLTLEEAAEECLNGLIRRSLVQVDEASMKGIPKTCRVHDLVRDVILSRSEELSFGHVSWNSSALKGIARHMSISKGGSDNPKGSTRSQTRSVMVFCGAKLQKPIIDAIFEKCKLLTTLDFEKCPIDEIPEELGNLLHLKYLSLRETLVSNLPKSIGKLQNLEFLDLSASLVDRLPVEVNRFPKLRYLLGNPKRVLGLLVRGSLGQLELLQTLFLINAGDDHERKLINEIGMLKQLRKLGIVNLKKENGRDLCIALENMPHLLSLSIASEGYGVAILDLQAMSSAPLHLQSLRLWGKLERLPEWISRLHNLAKLRLTLTMLMDGDSIKVLQALPNLRFLRFLRGYNGEKMHFEGGGFQKLKSLRLAGLTELNTIIIDQGAIPLLEKLEIGFCQSLKEVPSGIQHLKNLKQLSLAKMSDEFNERLSPNNGQDHWIVKHVPVLQYDGTYDPDDGSSYEARMKLWFG
ncbi:disease resistance protein RPM1 [Populus alba]|uniref:Disease resistance protein RPM1-like isoform X2 n=1 Tax=Populus alba TaxID=43335 RepID=A0A4V6ACT9_POPAL|nr:disease resistance protein RPM1-like [Populus alba]TKS18276.1 disease resistance protein RPM1-like isoform X2 [Populus alba]